MQRADCKTIENKKDFKYISRYNPRYFDAFGSRLIWSNYERKGVVFKFKEEATKHLKKVVAKMNALEILVRDLNIDGDSEMGQKKLVEICNKWAEDNKVIFFRDDIGNFNIGVWHGVLPNITEIHGPKFDFWYGNFVHFADRSRGNLDLPYEAQKKEEPEVISPYFMRPNFPPEKK